MQLQKLIILIMVSFIIGSVSAGAQDLSALDILKKMDAVVNAPKDAHQFATMILIDKDGNEKERKSEMYQKGDDMRLVRFLSPADQKGISFLSLPDDLMYLYLPAFRKTRRIASHVKNQSFAGTDFSYDDISAFKFADEYNPRILENTEEFYILELIPKPDSDKDYSKLKCWIRKDNFYRVREEYYDNGGNLWKVMERRELEKIGNYWIAKEMEMGDLKKQHRTRSIAESIELDTGLSDNVFTERNLMKVK